jgi:hypothetical protein
LLLVAVAVAVVVQLLPLLLLRVAVVVQLLPLLLRVVAAVMLHGLDFPILRCMFLMYILVLMMAQQRVMRTMATIVQRITMEDLHGRLVVAVQQLFLILLLLLPLVTVQSPLLFLRPVVPAQLPLLLLRLVAAVVVLSSIQRRRTRLFFAEEVFHPLQVLAPVVVTPLICTIVPVEDVLVPTKARRLLVLANLTCLVFLHLLPLAEGLPSLRLGCVLLTAVAVGELGVMIVVERIMTRMMVT